MLRSFLKQLQGYRHGLRAPLNGVNGFTGGGEIIYAVSINGQSSITVRLRGVAGREAEIFSGDTLIAITPIKNGRASKRIASDEGAVLPEFSEGAFIEVRQNGHVILSGAFADNR